MKDKLELLSDKVEKVCQLVEILQDENHTLKEYNTILEQDLSKFRKENEELKIKLADQSDSVKTKLTGVLNRLEQLEEISS